MLFSFYNVKKKKKKKTAITDKHCLQNVLIVAVWDDVNPVFDHSPRAISQIYLHYKTVWWKMHLLRSDYRLLQPNEQTFVLSTSPSMNYFLVIVMPFEFRRVLFFMSKSHSHMCYSSNVRKSCRASCWPTESEDFTTTSWGFIIADWEPFLHIIALSLFSSPHLSHHPPTSHCSKTPKNGFNFTCILWRIHCWNSNYWDVDL